MERAPPPMTEILSDGGARFDEPVQTICEREGHTFEHGLPDGGGIANRGSGRTARRAPADRCGVCARPRGTEGKSRGHRASLAPPPWTAAAAASWVPVSFTAQSTQQAALSITSSDAIRPAGSGRTRAPPWRDSAGTSALTRNSTPEVPSDRKASPGSMTPTPAAPAALSPPPPATGIASMPQSAATASSSVPGRVGAFARGAACAIR